MTRAWTNWRPPPKLTVSQWADAERRLSAESSAEPGRWHTDRAAYQREIMDVMSDIEVDQVVVIKGAQVGWTEIINNIVGYHIDQDPTSILIIQPTLEMAETWSKDRLSPMIRDTPVLARRVKDAAKISDTENTLRQKIFPGGRIAIIGANSPAGLASRPIRLVLGDEVDRYPLTAGTEGDPLALAAKRQLTFWNRKTLIGSTPNDELTSVINREWKKSDQRRFFVPCHACGHEQHLVWANVRWDKDEKGQHLPETAYYVCESCGALWNDTDRWDSIAKGRWKATAKSKIVGFHIPGYLSPWLKLETVVTEFLAARKDPQLLKVWTNTVLGEVWLETMERMDGSSLIHRAENYSSENIPDGVLLITAGVDVQSDRLELHVIGWGADEESWTIDYEIFRGDPAQDDVWNQLDEHLLRQYITESGRKLRVRAGCVDTGGHHGNQVIKFCNARFARRIYPTKGIAGPRPVWPMRSSRTKTNQQIYLVGVDTAKDTIYGRLKIPRPGPGYIHFPVGTIFNNEFYDQLTSEQVQTRYKEGRPYRVWVLSAGKRNEVLDTAVLALAARQSIPVKLKPIPGRPQTELRERPVEAEPLPSHSSIPDDLAEEVAARVSDLNEPPSTKTNIVMKKRRMVRRVARSGYMR